VLGGRICGGLRRRAARENARHHWMTPARLPPSPRRPRDPPRGAAARSRTPAPCTASHSRWRPGRGVRFGFRRDDHDQDPRLRTHGAQAARRSASAASSRPSRVAAWAFSAIISARLAVLATTPSRSTSAPSRVLTRMSTSPTSTSTNPTTTTTSRRHRIGDRSPTGPTHFSAAGCNTATQPPTRAHSACLPRAANRRGTHAQSRRLAPRREIPGPSHRFSRAPLRLREHQLERGSAK
jgi:hypothetical protein